MGFRGIGQSPTGDPAQDLLQYKIELERRLRHSLRNIDVSSIILGLTASKLVSTNASGNLESVSSLIDWIEGTANEVTVTDNLDGTVTLSLPDDVVTDSLKLNDLTATRLTSTDADKKIVSISTLSSWIAGTTNRITVTDDGDGTVTLSLPQNINTTADVEFDSIKLNDLTATRLASTDSNKKIVSISDLTIWIAGTTNQVTVTNDGDGSVTLSLPQNINTTSSPTFSGIAITGDNIKINTAKTPSSATDTGTTGTICWDSAYLYVCISTDTWVRTPLATW